MCKLVPYSGTCASCGTLFLFLFNLQRCAPKTAGFFVGDLVKDYYKRIEPPDAVVLSKSPPFPELVEKPAAYA